MAKYQWTAKDETVGQPPTGLQNALEGSLADWVIAANAGALGGKTIKLVDGLSQARRRLIIPGANGGSGRIDVRGRFYRAGGASVASLTFAVVRLKGATATDGYEYRADLDTASARPRVGRYNGSAYTEIAEATAVYDPANTWLNFRYTFNPDSTPNHVVKVWRDSETEETGSVLSTSGLSAAVDGAGIGFGALQINSSEYNWITVGTAGDDADVTPAEGGGGGTVPTGTVTIGTITPGTTSASVPYSYSAADQTGFEYRLNGGTAASIGASPATISGLTASTPYSIEVRAINAAGAGAWSAVSNFTTEAEGPGNLPPIFDGPSIAAISGTEGIALSALDVSARFSDAESALTFSAVGSWPAGVTVSSAGVISGTPTTAGTYASLQVRATDSGSLTADSNTFSITVAAAALPSTITVTEPLKNNTGTLLASISGVRVAVLEAATLAGVYETSGLTTNASGILAPITDASITTGQQYHVAIKLADGGVGITGPITAS